MAAYMRESSPADPEPRLVAPRPAVITMAVAIGLVLILGVLPSGALGSALETAGSVLQDGSAPVAGVVP
jgi:hypothetical protein